MKSATFFLPLSLVLCACSDPVPIVVVEVSARPDVRGVTALAVSLENAGTSSIDTLELGGSSFPVTFSISAAGRSGHLDIEVRGLTSDSLEAGRGRVSVDLAEEHAELLLDPSDFVVNSEFAGLQVTNTDFETNGFQLRTDAAGVVVGFRDGCPGGFCSLYGRRFDPLGLPRTTTSEGTAHFRWNTADAGNGANLALVTTSLGDTVALWEAPGTIACRALTAGGDLSAPVVVASGEVQPSVVSAAELASGDLVIAWSAQDSGAAAVRAMVVSDRCAIVLSPYTVAGPTASGTVHSPAVTAAETAVFFSWIDGDSARFRLGNQLGLALPSGPSQTGSVLVTTAAPARISHSRTITTSTGFVTAYRRSSTAEDVIALRRLTPLGQAIGADSLVAAYNDSGSGGAPAIALRSDGALGVTWAQCDDSDGNGCGVYFRLTRVTGLPVGEIDRVNTTVLANQHRPSITALDESFAVSFTDESGDPPDLLESAARLRFLYPAFTDARSVVGADCESPAPACDQGLVCTGDNDGERRCHAGCNPQLPIAEQCPGGGICTGTTDGDACLLGS
jgi:hypothetical protein